MALLKLGVDNNCKTKSDNTQLISASQNGNVTIVTELIKHGANVNCKNKDYDTPIIFASQNGHVTIVTELIKNGADVNCKNKYDDTPIILASHNGHETIVTELIKHGADVNCQDKDDNTPIIFASQNGHLTIVTDLIKHGAEVNCKNKNDSTPIIFASQNGHVTIVTELIKHGADVNCKNKYDDSPIILASQNGHVAIVTELIKNGADVNCKNNVDNTPIIYASQDGYVTIITELIKHGADVNCKNKDDNTPIIFASQDGHLNTVTELIKHGADLNCKNKDDDTPIIFASQDGHVTIVTELIKHGADVNCKNNDDNTPISLATQDGHMAVLTELLKGGVYVNCKNNMHEAPLYIAAVHNQEKIVIELINYGAVVNIKNAHHDTPLHIASLLSLESIVTELLKHGANVNCKNKNDNTPLINASQSNGHVTIVSKLIKYGAAVNFKNKNNYSPLHFASFKDHLAIVTELIKHGADINYPDKDYNTPLHYACQKGNLLNVLELVNYGALINSKNIQNETPLYSCTQQGHLPVIKELLKQGGDLHFKIDSDKSFLSWASENGYDIKKHDLLLEPLLKKIYTDYIFIILSELYMYNLPEELVPVLQTVIFLFMNNFSLSELNPDSGHIMETFDIEIFFIKLFGFDFLTEFISFFTNMIKTDKTSSDPPVINLPGIGEITYHELLEITNQFYDLPKDICKFLYDFKNLFKFTYVSKSHDFQNDLFEIFSPGFIKEYQFAIDFVLEEYKCYFSFAGCKDIEFLFEKLRNEMYLFGLQKVLCKIGGAITSAMKASVEPKCFDICKHFLHDNEHKFIGNQIPSNDDRCYLQQNFYKLLVKNFIKDFQPPYIRIDKLFEKSDYPADLDIQGSAGEGFLVYGKEQSDLDFIYKLSIFKSSLKFNKLMSCPDAPAYVMIEVTPNLSESNNEKEKQLLMENLKHKSGTYYLNIKHVKQLLYKQEIECCLPDHQVLINSDDGTCFRIQFFYNVIQVMINHFSNNISNLTKLSDSFVQNTEIESALEAFFKGISENWFVSQRKFGYFKRILKLYLKSNAARTSNFQNNPSTSKEKHLQIEDFDIDVEIQKKMKLISACDLFNSLPSSIRIITSRQAFIEKSMKFLNEQFAIKVKYGFGTDNIKFGY